MIELIKCPFCASEDVEVTYEVYEGCRIDYYRVYVECNTCCADGPIVEFDTNTDVKRSDDELLNEAKEKVAQMWNARRQWLKLKSNHIEKSM